ncbi:restriction endonuclease, partial [Vibrio anguillarum]|nr:restriction endonuclease [Vibrio anguillarum]
LTRAVGGDYGSTSFELRLQVLEAASARFGGFDLTAFHESFGIKSKRPASELLELAAPVASAIERSPIHPALALSVLAREVLHEQDRKSTGAYHTDFRLATRLAKLAAPKLTHKSKVIDPAC